MKVDDDQEVSDLFASSIRFDSSTIDISVKKFVYRLISDSTVSTSDERHDTTSISSPRSYNVIAPTCVCACMRVCTCMCACVYARGRVCACV